MQKLSLREELQRAKKDLLEILGNYLDSCVFLQDTKQLRRFTRSLNNFLRREVEIIRAKEIDVEILNSKVEIREDGEVHVVEVKRDDDGKAWGCLSRPKRRGD